jgi:phosphoribosylamine--glycine ligase
MREVIQPTLKGMAAEGMPYSGFLYAGIMVTVNGPKVLEFNCRLGDPEAQPLLMRLQSDLLDLCQATLTQTLNQQTPQWYSGTALGVVLAAGGYPQSYQKGVTIQGLDNTFDEDCKVFHAGTRQEGSQVHTDGGRVLCVCARGDSVNVAQQKAYDMSDKIHWENYFFRRDIGNKALSRPA